MRDCFSHFLIMAISGTEFFSQGSVATYARYDGIFSNHFVANFGREFAVKEL